jgi:hypothetical protein
MTKYLLRILLGISAAAFLCTGSESNTSELLPLKQANASSDIVALVRIEAAKAHFVDKLKCGVAYEGRMVRLFKNNTKSRVSAGPKLKFGGIDDLKIGSRYLVFLTNQSSVEDRYTKVTRELALTDPRFRDSAQGGSKKEIPGRQMHFPSAP